MANITIDGQKIEVQGDQTILHATLGAGLYIPHLCSHPLIDPLSGVQSLKSVFQGDGEHKGTEGETFGGCNLCLVEIQGQEGLSQACKTKIEDGMTVTTDSPQLKKTIQENLAAILERHPHACLNCPQAEGCGRKICSIRIPEKERCCWKFGNCELQKVVNFIGIGMGLPRYLPLEIPTIDKEPLVVRNYNLCIGCMRCVKVCKEIRGADALGFTLDGHVAVGSKCSTLKESGCKFCGLCVEVCPTGALRDRDAAPGEREKYLVPCRSNCPAGVDVPRYIHFMKEGQFGKALEVIYEKVPFPRVLGRVCFHPCENHCRRGSVDQPVAICALKRTAADQEEKIRGFSPGKKQTNKKVAVIGSGPAGLTAAYYLRRLGHAVTVFEALPVAGGMLRVGIPAYRLPRDIIDEEIKAIVDTGIEIRLNHRIDSYEAFFSGGFKAIFVSTGCHKGLQLGISGDECDRVIDGVTFLRKVNLGLDLSVGERVAIIGGGNVATDAGRCAIRKGAKEVTLFYRRTRAEMPAYEEDVDASLEEGMRIEYQVAPKKIREMNGALAVEFIRMKMGEPDHSHRKRPVPMEGTEHELVFDTVITAVGQQPDVPERFGIPENNKDMNVNPTQGVFLGGDLFTGPRSVIEAIAGGRRGAALVDRFLGGDGNIDLDLEQKGPRPTFQYLTAHIDQGRALTPMLPPKKRVIDFSEIGLGLDRQTAVTEAGRCLGCDLRLQVKPAALPPERWLRLLEENIQGLPEAAGIFVLYGDDKEVYQISGVEDIYQSLKEVYEKGSQATYFTFEQDEMFTAKERQLIQQYMKKHGKMPPGNDIMDELF